jgi:xylulokinase
VSGSPPNDEQFVLAVDLGTGGPKVGLVSLTGVIAWHDHIPVTTRHLPRGGAVQDANEWWDAIVDATRRALASGVVDPTRVVAVSCTGQYASTVPVDGAGVPVGDCLLWMDSRGRPQAKQRFGGPISGYDPRALFTWVRRTGGAPSTTGADPLGHRLYLAAEEPEVLRQARWLMEPVDQLSMRFTGVASATPASMVAAWLTDNRNLGHLGYDPDLVARAGIDERQLPPLVATGSVVGVVLPEVATALGFPAGSHLDVVSGTPDLHTAALGSGAVLDHQAHVALSTSSWVSCPVPFKKTDVVRQIASVPGLPPTGYLVIDNHEVGGLSLQWFRDNVVAPADALLPGSDTPVSFDDLSALAATAEAGSGNVIFTPWLNGERSPIDDRRARGGFHNLSLATDRAALARSLLEGVAYNTRWLHEAVERFVKQRLDPVRIIGGGATSDVWCQIHADVMDRVIERPSEPMHANLRGAALFAGISLGRVRLHEVPSLVGVEQRFRPDRANRAVYDRLFAEFPGLYSSQKKMFHRLNRT